MTFARHDEQAAELAVRYGIPPIACSDTHTGMEVAMAFNALPAFSNAKELRAALQESEWHGTRSTKLIHVATRWAVWSKAARRRISQPDR